MAAYRCVRCLGTVGLIWRDAWVECRACGARFPRVGLGAFPVMVADPSDGRNRYGTAFREEAAKYDERYRVSGQHGRWVLERLVSRAPDLLPLGGGVTLEIGAGTGQLTRTLELGSPLPFQELLVTDLSPEMLDVNYAHRNDEPQGRVEYIVCNVLTLPLDDESVDLALGLDILHHISNYPLGLREIARVLRPGGMCAFKEPHREAYRLLEFLTRLLLRMGRDRGPFRGLSGKDQRLLSTWREHLAITIKLNETQDHEALSSLDDKYSFDPRQLAAQATEAGFRSLRECNILDGETQEVRYGPMLLENFRGLGVSERGQRWMAEVCEDLDETIGPLLLRHAPINSVFVFQK